MKKPTLMTSLSFFMLVLTVYVGSYLIFRARHTEIWEHNQHTYVIFPKDNLVWFYFYRPLTYIDGPLTGMRFHIGPHQGTPESGVKPPHPTHIEDFT